MSQRYASFDEYGIRYFPRHLARNGRFDKLREILLDFEWMQAKLEATDPQLMIDDYDLFPQPVGITAPDNKSLFLIQQALLLSANVLVHDKAQLPSQLTGRLLRIEDSHIRVLLEQMRKKVNYPWLRPLTNSLKAPGTGEERTLQGFGTPIAFTPDGKRLITNLQGKVKVLNFERLTEEYTVPTREWVHFVSITRSGDFLVCTPNNSTPLVWNLKTNRKERDLGRHWHWGFVNSEADQPVRIRAVAEGALRGVSASNDGCLTIWNLHNGKKELGLQVQKEAIAIALTDDEERMIVFLMDGTIQVWDLRSAVIETSFQGHLDGLEYVAVTFDGKYALSLFANKTCRVWNLSSGKEIDIPDYPLNTVGGMHRLRIVTWDGGQYLRGSQEHGDWDLLTGQDMQKRPAPGRWLNMFSASGDKDYKLFHYTSFISSVAITPDSHYYITGTNHGTIKVWNLTSGEEEFMLIGHRGGITAMAVTPDSHFLISASLDGLLRVWDIRNGREILNLEGIAPVAVNREGSLVVSGSDNGTLKLWDFSSGKELFTLSDHDHMRSVEYVEFMPDDQRIISLSRNDGIWLWNISTGQKECVLQTSFPLHGISSIGVSPDGQRVVAGGGGALTVWNLVDGAKERVFSLYGLNMGVRVLISPDGRQILASSVRNDDTKVIRMPSGIEGNISSDSYTGNKGIASIMCLNDRSQALIKYPDELKIWDIHSMETTRTIPRISGSLAGFTPDGKHIFLCQFQTIETWDLEAGKEEQTIQVVRGADDRRQPHRIASLVITPDGKRAITGSTDGKITIWDPLTGEKQQDLLSCRSGIVDMLITPDGQRIIFSTYPNERSNRIIKIWNLATSTEEHSLETSYGLSISPDGNYVIHGSINPGIPLAVYNLATGQEEVGFQGHSEVFSTVEIEIGFSSDSQYMLTITKRDNRIKVWNFSSRQCVASFYADSQIKACTYESDGQTILVGDALGQIHVLHLEGVET